MNGGVYYPRFYAGSTQQRLNGELLLEGSVPAQQEQHLTICLLGDSNTASAVFREEFWSHLRKTRGKVSFVGSSGLGSITGGIVGRRLLGDWRHDGFSGRRLTRTYSASVASSTFTSVGHDLSLGGAVVFTAIDGGISGISTGTIYWATNVGGTTFQVAATQGGSALTITGSGNVTVGTGLVQLWAGIPDLHSQFPDLVVVKAGTNDVAAGTSANDCLTALSGLIDLIETSYPDADILVCAINEFAPGSVTGVNQAAWNAVRNDYVAGIPGLLATKSGKVGFYNTQENVEYSDFDPDGVHLTRIGYNKEGFSLTQAINRLYSVTNNKIIPRFVHNVDTVNSLIFDSASDSVSIAYDARLSPEDESFAFGFWYYPTALPTDSSLRTIIKYGDSHPNGYALGHIVGSGNGGGLAFYLANGSPIFSGTSSAAYSWEALELNKWHRVVVVCDRNALKAGLFINGQLILWAPVSSTWNVTETQATRFGANLVFSSAQGYLNRFFFAKGSEITVDDALEFVERDFYEHILFPGTTAYYPFDEGTGTSSASDTVGLPSASLSSVTWLAEDSSPSYEPLGGTNFSLIVPSPVLQAVIDDPFAAGTPEILSSIGFSSVIWADSITPGNFWYELTTSNPVINWEASGATVTPYWSVFAPGTPVNGNARFTDANTLKVWFLDSSSTLNTVEGFTVVTSGSVAGAGLMGPTGPTGPTGSDGNPKTILGFGNSAHATSGTRYFDCWSNPNSAGTGVRRMVVPCNGNITRMDYCNTGIGTGTGTYDVTLCTVSGDTPSTTALTMNIDLDVDRTKSVTGSIAVTAGTLIAVQSIANGTISASPSNPQISLLLEPT